MRFKIRLTVLGDGHEMRISHFCQPHPPIRHHDVAFGVVLGEQTMREIVKRDEPRSTEPITGRPKLPAFILRTFAGKSGKRANMFWSRNLPSPFPWKHESMHKMHSRASDGPVKPTNP
jgi:hypothetical protein